MFLSSDLAFEAVAAHRRELNCDAQAHRVLGAARRLRAERRAASRRGAAGNLATCELSGAATVQ